MDTFQGFYFLFKNTYLKEHFWVAASDCCNREASQGSTDFFYYSWEYLDEKKRHSKLFPGEYLVPGGNTYLLVNKYWGNSYASR